MIASKSFVVGRVKSADPSKGIHVPTYREKKEAAKQAELDKGRNERIKILEVILWSKVGANIITEKLWVKTVFYLKNWLVVREKTALYRTELLLMFII